MIPKIICLLFGHKRTWKAFTGEYGTQFYGLSGQEITVPIMVEKKYTTCPRCGKPLPEEK